MTEPIVIFDDFTNEDVRIDESPFSASTTDNWVARLGGLPPYIRGVTRGVMKSGHTFTDALRIAIGVMHIWAEGRNPWSPHHTGHVTPATQAKAVAALAHWEAMKGAADAGAAHRSVKPSSAQVRDGMSFVGEGGSAGLFLPAGPSSKQDAEIHKKETTKPHRFSGDDLSHCSQCGKPITASVHRPDGAVAAQPIPPVPREAKLFRDSGMGGVQNLTTEPHDFQGHAAHKCELCGKPIHAPMHQFPHKSATHRKTGHTAPIVALKDDSSEPDVRHRGPDHSPVSSGHIKGVPARHKKAAYAANQRNFATLEPPLEASMCSHFEEQHKATVNRLMGKRGGRMLKRYVDEMDRIKVLGAEPAHFPMAGDDQKTTMEPNTTTPLAEPHFMEEIEAEKAEAKTFAHNEVVPGEPDILPDINPQEIFDHAYWAAKLANVLLPHLSSAGALAHGAVRSQVNLPHDTPDADATAASSNALRARAASAAEAITLTTGKHIAAALQQGVAHGEMRGEIAKRLDDVFDKTDVRAAQIAQTQAVGGYNEAATTYAMHLPTGAVYSKVWLAHNDAKTRPTHAMADGQTRPVEAPFMVGAAPMHFPGSLMNPVGEYINCRCSQAFLPWGMQYGSVANVAESYANALSQKPPPAFSPYAVNDN